MRIVLVAVCVALLGVSVAVQQQSPTAGRLPDRRNFRGVNDPRYADVVKNGIVTRKVAGQVYVLAHVGGNVVVMAGDDGILLVDNNFSIFWEQIHAAIRRISDKPIRFVINSHNHGDHVENNENLAKLGATIFAHPNTRIELQRPLQGGGMRPPGALPTVTSSEQFTFHFNGEEITFVPFKRAHSPGDAGVYFRGSDVFAFGDVFTNDYPAVAVGQGGTIENTVDNYNLGASMGTARTVYVPGHGQPTDRTQLLYVRDAITTIHDRVRAMVSQGMTLEQIREARPSREFDERLATEVCCADFGGQSPLTTQQSARFYTRLYDEAIAHTNGNIGTVHQTATDAAAAAARPAAQ